MNIIEELEKLRRYHYQCEDCVKEYYIKNKSRIDEYSKNYYRENKEKKKTYQIDYYIKNKERILERTSAYKKAHKSQSKEYKRRYYRDNPDKVKEHFHRRKARLKANGGSYTVEEWLDLCKKYDNKCLCCGKKEKLTVDHIVPLSRGGTNYIENIQPLCNECNASKGNHHNTDYRY